MPAADTKLYPSYSEGALQHPVAPQELGILVLAADVADALDEANDKLILRKLPKNIKLLGWTLYLGDFDTHVTPACEHSLVISDGTTTKKLIDSTTVGRTGGSVDEVGTGATPENLGFVLDTDDYELYILTETAPATAADGQIYVGLRYTSILDHGERE